jgi:hypothetical protein
MRVLALMLVLLSAASAQESAPKSPQSSPPRQQRKSILLWDTSPQYVDFFLNRVPQPNPIRLAQLKRVFVDLECRGPRLRQQSAPQGNDLLCTLPGTGAETDAGTGAAPATETILFLAHYEHDGAGQSAIEDWSGAIMLPFIYHALSASPRRCTFLFAEVSGEAGARALFESFTPVERHAIKGVVALDALGLGPAQFYISPFDDERHLAWSWLVPKLLEAAAVQQAPAPAESAWVQWLKVDDTREFRHHNIPLILVHSVSMKTDRLSPGSARDTAAAIDRDAYLKTIKLLSIYAAELDEDPPSPFP